MSSLRKSTLHVTKYRALRGQIFEFLNVSSYQDIQNLLADPTARESSSLRAYTLLGNMFGIQGSAVEIKSRVNEYSRTADTVINSLKSRIFAPYASHVAITNEVEIANDPVDLLLMCFDDRYHKKARFELIGGRGRVGDSLRKECKGRGRRGAETARAQGLCQESPGAGPQLSSTAPGPHPNRAWAVQQRQGARAGVWRTFKGNLPVKVHHRVEVGDG